MDLSYGAEYEAFRGEVCEFLEASWPPAGTATERPSREQIADFRQQAVERGYLYRNVPRRYGGSEQAPNVLRGQILREEFRRARAPMEVPGNGMSMVVPTLLERGAEWQKERFIPPTVRGEYVWCQGYSEPGSGSDLASLRTRGELHGDEWVINGQKIWTSSARESHYMYALVRTEPDLPKHAGISYLLIDMKQPGIEVRPLRQITGEADFCEVFFNDARTPADWIVGKRGEGWQTSRTTLKHERNSIGGATQSQQLFDSLLRLARSSRKDGRPALDDPSIRKQLARLQGQVRSHLYTSYTQLSRDAAGKDPGITSLMNKLVSTNIGHEVAQLAIELLGDDGLLAPDASRAAGGRPGRERWLNQFMGSLGIAIAGGTSNIQRNVIAERGLGLPRDAARAKSE